MAMNLQPGDRFRDVLGHTWTVMRVVREGWQFIAAPASRPDAPTALFARPEMRTF